MPEDNEGINQNEHHEHEDSQVVWLEDGNADDSHRNRFWQIEIIEVSFF